MSSEANNELRDYEDDIESENFGHHNEELYLEDLDEEARLQEHAAAIRQYVAAAEADTRETEVDSDEERSIIRDIRTEITRQVRKEMADRGEDIGVPTSGVGEGEGEAEVSNEEHLLALDPQLREELERMRKLDKVLLRKIRREREVKRSRLEQERKFREELRLLDESSSRDGSKLSKDVRNNMLKFMALKPPPKHNAGVYSEDSPPPTPVFQTEYLDGQGREDDSSRDTEDGASSNAGSHNTKGRRSKEAAGAQGGSGPRLKPDKDFIKRNIELAGMASEVVAMTEDERARLDTLLGDLDALPMSFETTADEAPDISNPFKVAVRPGEGFTLDNDLRKRMDEIDSRLALVMPSDDLESLRTPTVDSDSVAYQPSLYVRMQLEPDFDLDQLGELALKEVKASRDSKQRLESIESGLESLRTAHEEEVPQPHLDAVQLEQLLGQCARSLSRTTASATPSLSQFSQRSEDVVSDLASERTELSEIEEWLQHPPRLEPDVLQRLLAESRAAGIGTGYLPALPEAPGAEGEEDSDSDTQRNGSTSRNSASTLVGENSSRMLTSRPSLTHNDLNPDLRSDSDSDTPASPLPHRSSSSSLRRCPQLPLPTNTPANFSSAVGASETAISSSGDERLVLPDITMFAHMTAPKKRPS